MEQNEELHHLTMQEKSYFIFEYIQQVFRPQTLKEGQTCSSQFDLECERSSNFKQETVSFVIKVINLTELYLNKRARENLIIKHNCKSRNHEIKFCRIRIRLVQFLSSYWAVSILVWTNGWKDFVINPLVSFDCLKWEVGVLLYAVKPALPLHTNTHSPDISNAIGGMKNDSNQVT